VNDAIFWIAVAVLAAGVVLMVATPMLRAGERMGRARRASYDLAVFRDQLGEVDRDLETGRLNESEAAAAKSEIERRMLKAVDAKAEDDLAAVSEADGQTYGAVFPVALGLVIAGASVALYLNIGEPGAHDMPFAQRTDVGATQNSAGSGGPEMVARLRERLRANPSDVAGWVTLARTHRALNEHPEAVQAFQKAIEISGQTAPAEMLSDYGESLVFESFGTVSPRAVETFEQALAKDPRDIKSRFYIAMARGQAGDYRGAIALWRGLSADAPPDAPWLEAVKDRITDAAMRGNIVPIEVPAEYPSGRRAAPGAGGLRGAIAGDAAPDQGTVSAAQDMTPEDRQAFIGSMVQRLADKMEASPNDVDGWLRLGRAYRVLEDEAKASYAFGRAKTRLEDLLAAAPDGSPTRPAVAASLREVEALLAQ